MQRVLLLLFACPGLLVLGQTVSAQDTLQQGVNFQRDIAPIFEKHCLECHGEQGPRGGLQLDTLAGAEFGGDSISPILGGTLETNEIYLRVSTDDMTYRMPKRSEPLSVSEIEIIRRWVEAGTPWVDPDPPVEETTKQTPKPDLSTNFWNLVDWADSLTSDHPDRSLWLMTVLGLQLLILVIERAKKRYRNDGQVSGRFAAWARGVRWKHYALIWMVLISAFVVPVYHRQLRRANNKIAVHEATITKQSKEIAGFKGTLDMKTQYGDPPIPYRSDHPAALSYVYYRGNCERNSELFNDGNYRTAELHISLKDTNGRLVEAGDPVLEDGLVIHFELHRSPGTTPVLFTEAVMCSVFLSERIFKDGPVPSEGMSDIVHLSTLVADWKWSADFPIDPLEDNGKIDGMIYVNKGRVTSQLIPQRVSLLTHYGIRYELSAKDGRLSPDSEIWMGCLFQTPPIARNEQNRVPFNQWFDHNPLPVITGTNTTDPELLGLPEHLNKTAGSDSPQNVF